MRKRKSLYGLVRKPMPPPTRYIERRRFDRAHAVDTMIRTNREGQWPSDDESPYTWEEFLGEGSDE